MTEQPSISSMVAENGSQPSHSFEVLSLGSLPTKFGSANNPEHSQQRLLKNYLKIVKKVQLAVKHQQNHYQKVLVQKLYKINKKLRQTVHHQKVLVQN